MRNKPLLRILHFFTGHNYEYMRLRDIIEDLVQGDLTENKDYHLFCECGKKKPTKEAGD